MSKKGSAGKIVAGVLATAIVGGAVGGTVAYFQDETFHNKVNEIFKIDEAKADSPVNEEKDEYTLSLEQEIERLKNQSLQLKLDYELKLTEKENSISGLKESLSSVQNELASKTKELETATETISSLTTQKAEIESQLETANLNYAELQEQKTQVDSELETANKTISTLTTQKQSLENQLETANSNYEELQNQKQEVDSELQTANETISTLTTQKQSLESQLETANSNITTITAELEEVESELETANADIETLTSKKAELESKLETANSNYAELQEQKTQVDSELQTANETISTLTTQKQSLESQLETANSNYAELQSQKQEVDSELETANETISNLTTQKQSLESQLETANSNISTLTSEKQELETELTSANSQITILTSTKETLEGQLETANSTIETLTTQKQEVEEDLEEANETINSLQSQISTLESDKTSLQGQITSLNDDIDELEAHIDYLGTYIDSLEEQIVEDFSSYNDFISSDTEVKTFMLSNGCMFIVGDVNEVSGTYLYNFRDATLTKVLDDSIVLFNEVNNNEVLLVSSTKVYSYSISTKLTNEFTGTVSLGTGAKLFDVKNNKFIVKQKNGTSTYVLIDMTNKTFSQKNIDSASFFWDKEYQDDTGNLFMLPNDISMSASVYDVENGEIVNIKNTSNGRANFGAVSNIFKVSNGDIIFSSSNSNCSGLAIWNNEDKTFIRYSYYYGDLTYNYDQFFESSNGKVICMYTDSTRKYFICYDMETHIIETNISGSSNIGSYGYDTFEEDENGIRISQSEESLSGQAEYVYYYNFADKTLTKVE